jgi:hypothetical protein
LQLASRLMNAGNHSQSRPFSTPLGVEKVAQRAG